MSYEISHFDGYFHLFAAANIAYAISSGFRGIIRSGILNITKINASIVDGVITKYSEALSGPIAASTNDIKTKVNDKINLIRKKFEKKVEDYEKLRLANRQIMEFKSLYLFTGIFSLVMLVVAGFQQFFLDEVKVWNLILCFDIIAILFIAWVAVLSFAFKKEKLISHSGAAFFCLVLFPLSFVYAFYCPVANSVSGKRFDEITLMVIAVLVPTTPFLMQVIKEILLVLKSVGTSVLIELEIKKELNKIKEIVDFLK